MLTTGIAGAGTTFTGEETTTSTSAPTDAFCSAASRAASAARACAAAAAARCGGNRAGAFLDVGPDDVARSGFLVVLVTVVDIALPLAVSASAPLALVVAADDAVGPVDRADTSRLTGPVLAPRFVVSFAAVGAVVACC